VYEKLDEIIDRFSKKKTGDLGLLCYFEKKSTEDT